ALPSSRLKTAHRGARAGRGRRAWHSGAMPGASDLPVLSLTTALGAGLLIGLLYERRKQDDPAIAAGLRSHTLLALAGAIAMWLGLPAFLAVLLMVGVV